MKEFLPQVESIPDLTIYHMDAADFALAEEGIDPISDVAIFKEEELLSYPVDVWDGTLYGEFAECCTKDNHIPKELFIEALKNLRGCDCG